MEVTKMTSRKLRQSTKDQDKNLKVTVQFISESDVKKVIDCTKKGENKEKGQIKKNGAVIEKNIPQSDRGFRKRKTTNAKVEENQEESIDQNEEQSDCEVWEQCEKPTDLCDEDDIAGDAMCNFRTPKKRHGMLSKAIESASKCHSGTPKTKRTPSKAVTPLKGSTLSSKKGLRSKQTPSRRTLSRVTETPNKNVQKIRNSIPKTPYNLRTRQIKDIKKYKSQLDGESDSDYEGSGSESSDAEPSPEESSDSDSGKGSQSPRPLCRRSLRFKPSTCATSLSKPRGKDLNYVFTADEYFELKSSKCKTSDHVLSKLRTPRMEVPDVLRLLRFSSMAPAHCSVLAARRAGDREMYERWMIGLSQGFSILAYGLGSKYQILQNFHREMLPDSHVLVINGFFPSLNIKEIVDTLARDLLGLKQTLPSPHAVIDWVEGRRWMPRVFLLVHNIDAEPLRCDKTQQLIARLASLPRVHLVASVDHINCPLLWDQAKLGNFNFIWEDTTSFLPYQEETSYETSLMVHNSGSLALSSLLNVYRSLTQNSRGVFRIIMQKHLDENSPKYTGMAFSELYGRCREEMLVTSDLALRTMLTEFLDHQMVKWRKDGEYLYIPTDIGVLRQFSNLIQNE